MGRSATLVAKAVVTLAVGMAFVVAFAALFTFAQHDFGSFPASFNINETVVHSLTHVNDETIVVALAAGVAAMLAFETRASSGVGVAISVTTIPAAAFLGVALGLGEATQALGALAVLGTNVTMIATGASLTLRSSAPSRLGTRQSVGVPEAEADRARREVRFGRTQRQ